MSKFIFHIAFVALFSCLDIYASQHECLCLDERFLEVGQSFTSVGYFRVGDGPNFGSGVLIDTEIPELVGRIVITAAHVLYGQEENLTFNLEGFRSLGKPYIFPTYLECKEKAEPFQDIALFLLDEVCNQPQTPIELNASLDAFHNSEMIVVGFGLVGHAASSDKLIRDCRRRGSYLHVQEKLNKLGKRNVQRIIRSGNEEKHLDFDVDGECIITLTSPWILSDAHCDKPYGMASPGDSGGGVFFSQNRKLVGVCSVSEQPHQKKEVSMMTPIYYNLFEEFIERKWAEQCHPRRRTLESFIVSEDDVKYIGMDVNRCDLSFHHHGKEIGKFSSSVAAFLPYHKVWLMDMFQQFLAIVK